MSPGTRLLGGEWCEKKKKSAREASRVEEKGRFAPLAKYFLSYALARESVSRLQATE